MILRKFIVTITFFLILPIVLFAQNNQPEIILNGVNMVPNVQTPGTGTAKVWVESDTLYVSGDFMHLQSYYFASNIHYGEEGETGNPIYKLKPDISEDHTSGSFDPEKNKFKLSEAMAEAYNNGALYITIASDKHRRGEIRGQVNAH